MSEHKCRNGDVIRVGGVYVWQFYTEPKIFAVTEIDRDHFLDQNKTRGMIENLRHELARDEDGYYIWDGGEQPVPDDWEIRAIGLDGQHICHAKHHTWGNVRAFRVISTVDVQQSSGNEQVGEVDAEQEDWCKVGAMVSIKGARGIYSILEIDEDKGCFLGCGLWKCRTELEPYETNTPSWNETVPGIPYRGDWLEFDVNPLDVQEGGDHYKKMKIQPMEYSMANKLDACQHTIIKYVSRFRDKGGIEDLRKAKHCIDMLIEFERGE